ncbi:MAG: hypothetical protein IPM77_02650 [Crocinitomicaceae bacterium]|nr:hypothetical protein [Crocinitomicaceae bacterium]
MFLKLFNHFRLGLVLFVFLVAGYYEFSDSFPLQYDRSFQFGKLTQTIFDSAESNLAAGNFKLTVKRCQE